MKNFITSEKCYIQETCKKFTQNSCNEGFCIRLYKVDELYNMALLSDTQKKYIKLILDVNMVDEPPYLELKTIKDNIIPFVENGNNLFICSTISGNGKTSWAIKLIQSYIHKIWATSDLTCRALFIYVPRYTRELKLNIDKQSNYIQHINEHILDADLVVWDDIAIKSMTDFEHEQLVSIIDSRTNDKKCNIFTSNILPSDLNDCLGIRLTSRILGNAHVVQFNGADKRGYKK